MSGVTRVFIFIAASAVNRYQDEVALRAYIVGRSGTVGLGGDERLSRPRSNRSLLCPGPGDRKQAIIIMKTIELLTVTQGAASFHISDPSTSDFQ